MARLAELTDVWIGSTAPSDTARYKYWIDTSALLLSAPTGHSATVGDTFLTLDPGTSTGAVTFNAYYTLDLSTPTKTNGTKITGVIAGYQLTGLTNLVPVKIVYTAVNIDGESVESTVLTSTPNAIFTDNFNRANGAIGASYTIVAGQATPQILTNALVTPVGGLTAMANANMVLSDNQYAQCDVSNCNATGYVVCGVRSSNAAMTQYRVVFFQNAHAYLYCVVNGASTQLGVTLDQAGITAIRVTAVGTLITGEAYYTGAWHAFASVVDANIASGFAGVSLVDASGVGTATGNIDNFECGNA
jgi:hypothetical protein